MKVHQGTGKTRTALKILKQLVARQAIHSTIITATGTDLLDQWVNQLYAVASNLNPKFRVLKHYATMLMAVLMHFANILAIDSAQLKHLLGNIIVVLVNLKKSSRLL